MALNVLPPQLEGWIGQGIAVTASDLLLTPGITPMLRVDSELKPIADQRLLEPADIANIAKQLLNEFQMRQLESERDIDFSFGWQNYRFRVNAFYQRGALAMALRLIPVNVPDFKTLGVPPIIERFAQATQGLFIVTGPAGHGKSTTLAAMVEYINKNRRDHVITIEDPIEYTFDNAAAVISQREVGSDTYSFARALRASLREDPDVILVGEMRDLETIETVLTLAETGHLVLTTLHTNSAAQTADRIVDAFPPYQQPQIRLQLSEVLIGVVGQRLLPKVGGGRILASEVMVNTPAIASLIRDGKSHQIANTIATGATDGMISLDKVLAELVTKGDLALETALAWASDQKNLKTLLY